ncbi:L-serine dehydratase [Paramyrothecium foliicola]|nr:L-serine dehydratase [Paramyrothecium foliicola]
MGSLDADAKLPWIKTPCILSPQLSKVAGCNIYLKLDCLQPSGSFKSRGIGNYMTRAAAEAPESQGVRFYCASGGNAGLACATSASALKKPVTIIVPTTTSAMMMRKLSDLGAQVEQVGENWAAADRYIREELLVKDPTGIYVPPFDHQHVWDGASTIVSELREQMEVPIDAIACSVGGGGMVNGIMQGIETSSWPEGRKPQVLAVETIGCDSLNSSVRAGEHVTLPAITSIATTLGASRVSAQTWKWYTQNGGEGGNMQSLVVPDADAAISCVRFADDARLVVEPSCGVTIALAYRGDLRKHLGQGLSDDDWQRKNVVLQVCGGSGVTLAMLEEYRKTYAAQSSIQLPDLFALTLVVLPSTGMMKLLLGLVSLLGLLPFIATAQTNDIRPREINCGKNVFDAQVICIRGETECCSGSIETSCMPVGYTCCESGFYRAPGYSCDPRPDPCKPGPPGRSAKKVQEPKPEEATDDDSAAANLLGGGVLRLVTSLTVSAAVFVMAS